MGKEVDYTGNKIGRLSFLSYFKKGNKKYWNIECDCGNQIVYRSDYISKLKCFGRKFECIKCKLKRRSPVEINSKYGRLTIIKEVVGKDHHRWFLCLCECGIFTEVPGVRLCHKDRPTRSCGCWSRKSHSKWANTTHYPPAHGLKRVGHEKTLKTRLYNVRCSLLSACYRKEDPRYPNYGAKGCTVCELWRNGAKEFVQWCLKNNYQLYSAIILKKAKKEFNPKNCLVVLKRDHISEKNSKFIEYKGEKKSLTDWATEFQCSVSCLSQRIKKFSLIYGIEKAMDMEWVPERKRFYGTEHLELEIVQLYQQGMTFKEISDHLGCSSGPIKRFLVKNNIATRPAKCRSSLT